MKQSPKPSVNENGAAAIRLRRFLSDSHATSIVEFGLITPIFLLALGAAIDFGMVVRTKFVLSSSLATASNYALNNASNVSSTGGPNLASTLATLIASTNSANWASSTVNVNNGPTASASAGSSTVTPGGTASGADSYYCPTGSGSSINWGTAVAQGSTCPAKTTGSGTVSGFLAGKFVVLTASRTYKPLIMPVSLFTLPTVQSNDTIPVTSLVISASSVVQVQ